MTSTSMLIESKQCSQCRRTFPPTLDHFYKRTRSRDGMQTKCKDCAKSLAYNARRRTSRRLSTQEKLSLLVKRIETLERKIGINPGD